MIPQRLMGISHAGWLPADAARIDPPGNEPPRPGKRAIFSPGNETRRAGIRTTESGLDTGTRDTFWGAMPAKRLRELRIVI